MKFRESLVNYLNFSALELSFQFWRQGPAIGSKVPKMFFLDVLTKGFFCKKAKNAIFEIKEAQVVPNIELVVCS